MPIFSPGMTGFYWKNSHRISGTYVPWPTAFEQMIQVQITTVYAGNFKSSIYRSIEINLPQRVYSGDTHWPSGICAIKCIHFRNRLPVSHKEVLKNNLFATSVTTTSWYFGEYIYISYCTKNCRISRQSKKVELMTFEGRLVHNTGGF